jgi:tRNA threonylcarbamoyladenosine biosynthesis protein TsaB
MGWYKSSKTGWQAQSGERIATLEEINVEVENPSIVCGEFSAEERLQLNNKNIQLASPALSVRRPAILAELAWVRWQAGDVDDAASLAPIYLQTDGSLPV